MGKLLLEDIVDARAYERERTDFRNHIIGLKKDRRLSIGPVLTLLFENSETIRFQIQEMARAEKIYTDEGIETELRVYNPLIPEPGNLAATLFLELTSDEQLREWLPKLVGIETSISFYLQATNTSVRCLVDPEHAELLTREQITAAVHYIHFSFTSDERDAFCNGPVKIVIDHENYQYERDLSDENLKQLRHDLVHGG